MRALPRSPQPRLRFWLVILALVSLADLGLTLLALRNIPTSSELNPLAAALLQAGPFYALALKVASLVIVALLARLLARTPQARWAERVLEAWCAIFLAIDLYSLEALAGWA